MDSSKQLDMQEQAARIAKAAESTATAKNGLWILICRNEWKKRIRIFILVMNKESSFTPKEGKVMFLEDMGKISGDDGRLISAEENDEEVISNGSDEQFLTDELQFKINNTEMDTSSSLKNKRAKEEEDLKENKKEFNCV